MMEYLELFHPDGYPSGHDEQRVLVHQRGRLHGAAHIWVYRGTAPDIELLFQKRSKNKDTFPGCYDVSCGGHVNSGENFAVTAIREMKEELGLDVSEDELTPVCIRHDEWTKAFGENTVKNNELVAVYLYRLAPEGERLAFHTQEIDELKWVGASELVSIQRSNSLPCCFMEDELEAVLARLNQGERASAKQDGFPSPPDRNLVNKAYVIHVSDPYSHPNASAYAGSDEWKYHEQYPFYGTLDEAKAEGKRLEDAVYDYPQERYLFSVCSWITEPGSNEPI